MNNNRLSTAGKPVVNRTELLSEIEQLLNLPSNYEIKDGRTFIKSLNRFRVDSQPVAVELLDDRDNIINSFNTYADCARFLEVTHSTVSTRAKKGNLFVFKGKLYYIRKI